MLFLKYLFVYYKVSINGNYSLKRIVWAFKQTHAAMRLASNQRAGRFGRRAAHNTDYSLTIAHKTALRLWGSKVVHKPTI